MTYNANGTINRTSVTTLPVTRTDRKDANYHQAERTRRYSKRVKIGNLWLDGASLWLRVRGGWTAVQ